MPRERSIKTTFCTITNVGFVSRSDRREWPDCVNPIRECNSAWFDWNCHRVNSFSPEGSTPPPTPSMTTDNRTCRWIHCRTVKNRFRRLPSIDANYRHYFFFLPDRRNFVPYILNLISLIWFCFQCWFCLMLLNLNNGIPWVLVRGLLNNKAIFSQLKYHCFP